ncbi:hypothetical protein DAEQUDRAFT_753922 [Daedalea quercina L-15889]|uniref:Uncharacterized protein n=1 Tax=Daedalea quercina L-15889 TaxID=1314783 RepID=A0A165U783_9APHY|nr:hypothetical protein DAEQUDRAFT_753922 [Daedalea quercina L-15889]
MGFLSDNPERAGRITQLATGVDQIMQHAKSLDESLSQDDLKQISDDVLRFKGYKTTDEMLASIASALDPEKKVAFLNMLEDTKASEPYKNLVAMIGGVWGADKLWQFFALPEMVGFKELAAALFTTELTISKSVLACAKTWFEKAPPAQKLVPGEIEMQSIRKIQPRALTHFEQLEVDQLAIEGQQATLRLRLARLAAIEEVALGSRVLARLGNVAVGIAIGVVIETAVEGLNMSSYKEAERECQIARLQAKYHERIFDALSELKTSFITARDALKDVDGAPPEARGYLKKRAEEHNKEAGEKLFQKLKDRNYETAYKILHEADLKRVPKPYLEDDMEEPELINATLEAVKKQAQKAAEEAKKKEQEAHT